jgi:hypothetical protein
VSWFRRCDMCSTEEDKEIWLSVDVTGGGADLAFCSWPCLASYAAAHITAVEAPTPREPS